MIIVGRLLIIVGIAAGLYLGVWWAFIGGIVQMINAFKATPVDALPVALGVARFVFSGVIGWVCAAIFISIGMGLVSDGRINKMVKNKKVK